MAVTMPIDMPESRNKRHIMIIEVLANTNIVLAQ
jgi:hypothetical protein